MKRNKKYWIPAVALLFLVGWGVLLMYVSPEEIVSKIGIQNSYLVAFLFAVFGGLSTVTGVSFFTSVAAFAAGGSNFLLLGLFGGLGIFISDSIFFFIARYGVTAIRERSKRIPSRFFEKIDRLPSWVVLLGTYVYLGFTPLPNDLLMILLAISNISYRRLWPVLLLGSITVVTLVAYFGQEIFALFF